MEFCRSVTHGSPVDGEALEEFFERRKTEVLEAYGGDAQSSQRLLGQALISHVR